MKNTKLLNELEIDLNNSKGDMLTKYRLIYKLNRLYENNILSKDEYKTYMERMNLWVKFE